MNTITTYLAHHTRLASAVRHAAVTAVTTFALTVLPVVQDLGAGKYDLSTDKALVLSAAAAAIAAGGRAIMLYVQDTMMS